MISVRLAAILGCTLVPSEVLETESRMSLFSASVSWIFMSSKTWRHFSLALSNPSHTILGSRGSGNQAGSRMLDLHFVEQYVSVLSDLDIARNIDCKGLGCSRHLSLGVQHGYGRHFLFV